MKELEKNLQYHFNNQHLLHQALTHTSKTGKLSENYERLEFLGDAVLEICVSRVLYHKYLPGVSGRAGGQPVAAFYGARLQGNGGGNGPEVGTGPLHHGRKRRRTP